MEYNTIEEENRGSSSSTIGNLPQSLMELILERLPFTDYIRFAAVCRSWEAIQKDNRRRRRHAPPPTHSLPWLVSSAQDSDKKLCYSPFEDRFYTLQLPTACYKTCIGFSNGWLLILETCELPDPTFDPSERAFLLNLISGCKINIPRPNGKSFDRPDFAAMSSAPTDPNCILMVITGDCISVCRVRDTHWTNLNAQLAPFLEMGFLTAPIFGRGKFYCKNLGGYLLAITPFPEPAIQWIKMENKEHVCAPYMEFLVESNGEMLLVVAFTGQMLDRCIKEVQVFKADLSKEIWVTMESLGDRVLIVSEACSISILAAEIGSRSNIIYFASLLPPYASKIFCGGCWSQWQQFDFGTQRMLDKQQPKKATKNDYFWKKTPYWVVPNLDCVNLTLAP